MTAIRPSTKTMTDHIAVEFSARQCSVFANIRLLLNQMSIFMRKDLTTEFDFKWPNFKAMTSQILLMIACKF